MVIELDENLLAKRDYRVNESFKALRTNILFCGDDVKVITFTSATPSEGKSSVSLNLAVSLAEMGKNVIYIDADLRKSVIRQKHRIKGVQYGFSHFLSGMKPFKDVAYTTNISNLHMVLSGPVPPNPSELLSGKYMKALVDRLRNIYDYVIIDTPPVGSVTDARIVSSMSDGVVLVISSGAISYKYEQKALADLKASKCTILGAVLNKVSVREGKRYGSYYGKYGEDNEYGIEGETSKYISQSKSGVELRDNNTVETHEVNGVKNDNEGELDTENLLLSVKDVIKNMKKVEKTK